MANPFFLFEQIHEDGTLSATSEAAGYPKENVLDWRAWNYWEATSTAAQNIDVDLGGTATAQPDTVVIAGHNGGSVSASHRVSYSTNGTSYSTAYSYEAFADDDPVVKTFTVGSGYQYWRVTLGNSPSDVVRAGIISLGRRLDLPRLHPDISPYSVEVVSDTSVNNNGQVLGTNVKYVKRTGFTLDYDEGLDVTTFWSPASGITFDDDFAPHLDAGKPFWFAWNIDQEARHVFEMVCPKRDIDFVNNINRRSLRMRLEHVQ